MSKHELYLHRQLPVSESVTPSEPIDIRSNDLPLSELELKILLSLNQTPAHGYAVFKDIKNTWNENRRIRASTFYKNIGFLTQKEFIEPVGSTLARNGQEVPVYQATERGMQRATTEIQKMWEIVNFAKENGVIR